MRTTLPLLFVVVVVMAMVLALRWATVLLLVLRLLAVFFELVFCLVHPSQQQYTIV